MSAAVSSEPVSRECQECHRLREARHAAAVLNETERFHELTVEWREHRHAVHNMHFISDRQWMGPVGFVLLGAWTA